MTTSTITFDPAAFRAQYRAFGNVNCYTDLVLQGYFDMATDFISNTDNSCYALNGNGRALSLNLLTAHLLGLAKMIEDGETPAMMQSATVDKVSVTVTPPPPGTQFQWWLGLTAYGQQLLALLQVKGVGGFYVGGLPERAAFRRVGGGFG